MTFPNTCVTIQWLVVTQMTTTQCVKVIIDANYTDSSLCFLFVFTLSANSSTSFNVLGIFYIMYLNSHFIHTVTILVDQNTKANGRDIHTGTRTTIIKAHNNTIQEQTKISKVSYNCTVRGQTFMWRKCSFQSNKHAVS